jgi:hypothetical protein
MKFNVNDIVEDSKGSKLKIINIDPIDYKNYYVVLAINNKFNLGMHIKVTCAYPSKFNINYKEYWLFSIEYLDKHYNLTIKSVRKQKLNKLYEIQGW